jgi:acyl carrier protein
MDRDSIFAALADIIREVLDDDGLTLSEATTADDIEGWDSMTHITIVVAAERRFHVKFNTAEIEELKNIGDFVTLIGKKGGRL